VPSGRKPLRRAPARRVRGGSGGPTAVRIRPRWEEYASWCRENGGAGTDPDLYWVEEAWCLVKERGLLRDVDPMDPTVLAHWARLRRILGALGG
jgi:hypothetical protein